MLRHPMYQTLPNDFSQQTMFDPGIQNRVLYLVESILLFFAASILTPYKSQQEKNSWSLAPNCFQIFDLVELARRTCDNGDHVIGPAEQILGGADS